MLCSLKVDRVALKEHWQHRSSFLFGVSWSTFSFLLNKVYKESDLLAVQAAQRRRFYRLLQYRDDASPYARQTGTWGSSGSARLLSRPWLSRAEMRGSRDADTRGGEEGAGGRVGWKRRLWQIRERSGRGEMEARGRDGGKWSGCLPSARGEDETAESPSNQGRVLDTSRFCPIFCLKK